MTWDSVYAMMSISNLHVDNYLESYKRASILFAAHFDHFDAGGSYLSLAKLLDFARETASFSS